MKKRTGVYRPRVLERAQGAPVQGNEHSNGWEMVHPAYFHLSPQASLMLSGSLLQPADCESVREHVSGHATKGAIDSGS